MYNSSNFIIPLKTGDTQIKIQNSLGVITDIIREATCTIKQNGIFLIIKQSAESSLINFDFISPTDAGSAHLLLRTALKTILTNQTTPLPPISQFVYKNSLDLKYENPSGPTVMDGQLIPGISPIVDDVSANAFINVEINGLNATIGNGCDATTFVSPQFDIVFAKRYTSFSVTSTSITILSTPFDFLPGDSVLIIDNGVVRCLNINSITGSTLNFLVTINGPVTGVAKTKRWGHIEKGDLPFWFGSNSGYELDTLDVIAYKYITYS